MTSSTQLSIKTSLLILLTGVLFGAGLAVSGMNDTAKVQGFLDVFGHWDISLAFVMASALFVGLIAFRFILKRKQPVFDKSFHIPSFKQLDKRLISGAFIFGIGWGLIGYCPGPAIASISYGYWQTLVFIISMLIGSQISRKFFP